jgi:hypothetical protein
VEARLAFQAAALKLSAAQTTLARIRGTATSNVEFGKIEVAAREAVDNAASNVEKAQQKLEDLRKKGEAASETIKQDQDDVTVALLELRKARADLADVTGQVFGPKLFAIRDEIRKPAKGETTSPFLEIIPVEQFVETHDPYWNSAQPKYPVKWPDAPKVRIFPEGVNIVPDPTNNSRWYALQSSVPLVRLVKETMTFEGKDTQGMPISSRLPPIKLISPTVITVILEGIPVGDYTLKLAYQTPDGTDGSTSVKFNVVK